MTTRREFMKSLAMGGAALSVGGNWFVRRAAGAPANRPAPGRRPNIILILDDQHNPRDMGWTGQSPVKTPSLDRLARQSVRFTNAYSSNPVCAPARHTLYTGLYSSDHGVLCNDVAMRDGVPTLMARLNEAGYTTANIGKMHNAPYHHRRDFQYILHHEFFIDAAGISHYVPWLNHELARRGGKMGPSWIKPKVNWLTDPEGIAGVNWMSEDLTPERWITDQALVFLRDQLKNRPDQPFFLHVSYFPPHHPYRPIRKYAEMYDPEKLEPPPNFNREMADAWCHGAGKPPHLSDADYRRFKACYYGFITQLDAEIGRLLEGVGELGLEDDTIVLFMSDHGDLMGEHGLLYKGYMYESSVRVPFMIRWPGVQAAREEAAPVSHIDVVPTLLAAAGLEAPADLPGRDLRPLVAGQSEGWYERPVYSEYFQRLPFTHIMLRKGDYKIFASARPRAGAGDAEYHLFNMKDDPWELKDLAADPAHRETFESMKRELLAFWERQSKRLPDRMPAIVPRSIYNIPWPADPWKAIEPAGPAPG
ncbi:MAG: sulfatase-like hydrolase/transferase [bacterium]|nr:sulfatase-like hydrolase/transferase [bacterium]